MSLIPPRYELPIVMDEKGRISREWYKYLVLLGNSVGGSTSASDDQQLSQVSDDAAVEGIALKAQADAKAAFGFLLLGDHDKPQSQDTSLLAWWPGETK